MEDDSVLTPNGCKYLLRSRTSTPKTPATPTSIRKLRHTSKSVPADHVLRDTPLNSSNMTPAQQSAVHTPSTPSTPKAKESLVFKTPMSFKPHLVGNRPVPSPSRQEIWKKELGLEDDPTSDKENTSSEDEDNQKCVTSQVEYRALQKVLAEKSAQRDESLLQVKNLKDKVRHYKTKLEREENTKRQQLKILKKTHEDHMQQKDQLIDNLQAIVNEQEERIKELEDNVVSTPRKRTRQTKQSSPTPIESTSKLIDDIKRLQEEKMSLTNQINEVQLELTTLQEDSSREIAALKETIVQLEKTSAVGDDVPNHRNLSHRSREMVPCSTDTEKQVEVLQAKNDRLLQELTDAKNELTDAKNELIDAKNAHTKLVTMSKLGSHRQQQLEEELKIFKQRTMKLESEVSVRTSTGDGGEESKHKLSELTGENCQLHSKVRELKAEIFTLRNKSPEVVKVTKVKEVESESLRERYEASKMEMQQLKMDAEKRKQDLQDSQTQTKCLEIQLKMAQSDKDKVEATLWKELNTLNTEHQESLKQLRERYQQEKQSEIQMLENRLSYEHEKELHGLVESLTEKHEDEILKLKASQKTLHSDLESQLSKLEAEKSELLSKIEDTKCILQQEVKDKAQKYETIKEEIENKNKELKQFGESLQLAQKEILVQAEKFATEKEELENKHNIELEQCMDDLQLVKNNMCHQVQKYEAEKEHLEQKHSIALKQCEEDWQIAKNAALTQLREELSREKETCLRELEQMLMGEHKAEVAKMESAFERELETAVLRERQKTAERMQELETKYEQLVEQLRNLQPIISGFVESYILLQKEVKGFPKIIKKTVSAVKKEMIEAITGISEYNKELVQKYQKEMRLRKKYHNELVELKGNIRVFCRVRPIIKEDGSGQQAENIITLDQDDDGLIFVNSKGRTQSFDVDKVFGENSSQQQVFEEVKALVTSCIDGYNVCIFAYGQTGSGKTYTMEGTWENPGINQRALKELFDETASRVDWEFTITVSVVEIYNEMIRDLLGDDTSYRMEVKMNPDGGYHIPGLCYVTVQSVADVNECFRLGQKNRATAATNMNEHSSRSHALLCVTVIGFNKTTAAKTTGKLNLVDLAGSERVSKSKADGARLKEAQNINKSLSSLGDVIFALRSKQSYIPYRNSKLTYLLQDSLGGDSKTLMITQIAPVRKNEGETICSLNFAQRVRNVELGAATRKLENGDGTEESLSQSEVKNEPISPSKTCSAPQKMTAANKTNTPTIKMNTPVSATTIKSSTPLNIASKPGTPSSSSKLTPVRQIRKKLPL